MIRREVGKIMLFLVRMSLALLLVSMATPARAVVLNVYILTGQSNALGTTYKEGTDPAVYGPGTDTADATTKFFWSNVDGNNTVYPPVLYGDSGGGITTLQSQQGNGAAPSLNPTFWGPEFGLARTLAAVGQSNVLIIKASRGGGGNGCWDKDLFDANHNTGHMWGAVRDTVDAALTAAQKSGYDIQVNGLLYLQGESNSTGQALAAGASLTNLIANLTQHINSNYSNAAGNMKTVIGEIAASSSTSDRTTTTSQQHALADSRSDISFIQTRDQPLKSDGIHFGSAAKLVIGQRFADAFLDLQSRPPSAIARYTADLAAPTAVPHPTTQGWTETGAVANVTLQGVSENSTRGWQIQDNSTSSNPGYYQPLTSDDFQAMFDRGWTFTAKVRVDGGGGLALWSATAANVPAGWGIADGVGNMNGFAIDRVNGDQFQVKLFGIPNAPIINLGADSANLFHTLELVGHAGSSAFSFFVDGQLRYASTLTNGAGLAGYEDRAVFNSGSTSGMGGNVVWNEVSLQTIPEPSTVVLLISAMTGLVAYAVTSARCEMRPSSCSGKTHHYWPGNI